MSVAAEESVARSTAANISPDRAVAILPRKSRAATRAMAAATVATNSSAPVAFS
jgi:hypothetical protein